MVKKNTHNRAHALFKKEANVLIWLASAVIILLFTNVVAFHSRLDVLAAKDAASTPKASQNIGVLSFTWQDNLTSNPNMYQPPSGYKIVGVNVQLLNLQTRDVWLAPTLESYIVDDAGVKYGMVLAEVSSPFKAGSYAPQTVAKGDLSYGVPVKVKNPMWCYELAPTNGGGEPVCLALNKYSVK